MRFWLMLLLATPSFAGKHPLYRAQRTLAGVATYHARHEVGNLLFSLAPKLVVELERVPFLVDSYP